MRLLRFARNDENSRIPRDCFGRFAPSQWLILGNSRIICDEIPRSSRGMTKKVKPEDDIVENSRILVIASEAKQSLGILEFIYGILNSSLEILKLFLEF